jgi:hypothetical protein
MKEQSWAHLVQGGVKIAKIGGCYVSSSLCCGVGDEMSPVVKGNLDPLRKEEIGGALG